MFLNKWTLFFVLCFSIFPFNIYALTLTAQTFEAVNIQCPESQPYTCKYNFGDGTIRQAEGGWAIGYKYSLPGTYNVTYQRCIGFGCNSTDPVYNVATVIIQNIVKTDYDVGVIPDTVKNCPVGSELVWFFMDDEDSSNANKIGGSYAGAFSGGRNNTFRFCRTDGRKFKRLSTKPLLRKSSYAVLKLGKYCPLDSSFAWRHVDNENSRNMNSRGGDVWPNISTHDTTLHLCVFADDVAAARSSNGLFPNLGVVYGVFIDPAMDPVYLLASGWIHGDDQDRRNRNSRGGHPYGGYIISGGKNTTYHVGKVRYEGSFIQ